MNFVGILQSGLLAGDRDEASAYFGESAPDEPEILMVSESRMRV